MRKSADWRWVFVYVGIDRSSADDDHIQHQTLSLVEDMTNENVDTVPEGMKTMSLKNLYIRYLLCKIL